jgi:hypothetical protein
MRFNSQLCNSLAILGSYFANGVFICIRSNCSSPAIDCIYFCIEFFFNSVICVSRGFVKVDYWKAFTCAVDVSDVHALNHNDKNPVSILEFVVENMIFYAV